MNRGNTIEIGGRVYPARFGIAASKAIQEKFGSLEKMADKLSGGGDLIEMLNDVSFVLLAVINQGCSYKNLFEKDIPKDDVYTVDGKCVPPTQEELDIALDFDNMQEVMGKVFELVNGATKRTVKAESKEKNTEAK